MIIKLLQAAWRNSSSVSSNHTRRLPLPKLTAGLIRLLENSKAVSKPHPSSRITQSETRSCRWEETRYLGEEQANKEEGEKTWGRVEHEKCFIQNKTLEIFFKFAVLEGFIDVFALEVGYSFQVLLF